MLSKPPELPLKSITKPFIFSFLNATKASLKSEAAFLENLDNLNIDDDLKKINNNEQQTSNQNEQQTSNQNEQINPEKNEIKKEITLEEAIKMYMQHNKLLIVLNY